MPASPDARTRLEAQLAELEDRLSRIERDLAEPADPDSSERAVQMDKMGSEALQAGRTPPAATFEGRAQEYRRSAAVLMDSVLER